MCCSAWPARFSKTICGTCEVLIDRKVHHVLWYQNQIGGSLHSPEESAFEMLLSGGNRGRGLMGHFNHSYAANKLSVERELVEEEREWRRNGGKARTLEQLRVIKSTGSQGNSLLIPILGHWNSIKLLDTKGSKRILNNISHSVQLPVKPRALRSQAVGGGATSEYAPEVKILQFDIYEIVLAERASAIPAALERISADKRPNINKDVFERMDSWYQSPIALCCFRQIDSGEGLPLGFAFEPLYPHNLMVYTLDGHDGRPPNASAMVQLDHTIFVGSYQTPPGSCARVRFEDTLRDDLRPYVLDYVMGLPINGTLKNGDIVFSTEQVRAGIFEGFRSLPPFAENGESNAPPLAHTHAHVIRRTEPYMSV